MVSRPSTLCPAHFATWVGGMARVEPRGDAAVAKIIRATGQRPSCLGWGQGERASLLPDVAVGRWRQHSPTFAAEQAAVRGKPVKVDVATQDGHEFGRDRHDTDGAARPVLQAALFVPGPGVGPLLTDRGRGLGEFEAAPAGLGKVPVVGPERERFRWPQHRGVKAGEERDETSAATWADVADGGTMSAVCAGGPGPFRRAACLKCGSQQGERLSRVAPDIKIDIAD